MHLNIILCHSPDISSPHVSQLVSMLSELSARALLYPGKHSADENELQIEWRSA